ncbi:hypothetical protein [Paraglaciecola sp.]|uniref:hypothetical protein n=1 Tax=Paraglaciecola sp. TaxID=1920173 RepID=UPI003EF9C705
MPKLLDKIKRYVLTKVSIGYFDGELKKIVLKRSDVTVESIDLDKGQFKPLVLIVSRDFYQEKVRSYPLVNKKELNKLLALDKHNNNTCFSINDIEDNQSWVNKWQFDADIPKANLLLPESVVLSHVFANSGELELVDKFGRSKLFIVNNLKGVYSARPTSVISNRALFRHSCGVGESNNLKTLEFSDVAKHLVNGLMNLSIPKWLIFNNLSNEQTNIAILFRPILIGLGVGLSYLMLTSAYLGYRHWQLTDQIANTSGDLQQALTLQNKNDSLLSNILNYQAVSSEFNYSSDIWGLMLPLFKKARISRIQLENGRYILRGEAKQATEVLSTIANYKGVSDAKFDLPVSKTRSEERFVVSFVMQNTLSVQ